MRCWALGGASWPRMGSDGGWVEILRQQGIDVSDLRSANCGFLADWSEHLRHYEGQPLKRVGFVRRWRFDAQQGDDHADRP